MAAAVVGGAFLSAFLDVVFDRLASPQVVNLIRGKKLDPKLLQRLETTLIAAGAVLDDAEKKQFGHSKVNNWLNDLKDAVYVADDLLDEVSTKAATQKKVSNLLSRFFNTQDREMVSMLEEIVVRLENILKLKESLDLKEIAMENMSHKLPSTSLPDGSLTYGRDEDKEVIIKMLLDDKSDGEQVSVIPIVGMGGVGKTTLAQLVYNDENLKQIFDVKAWVCVSEEFDTVKVTKTIIETVTRKTCGMNDLNSLQEELLDKLNGKKFLVVLDDVWMEDNDTWNLFKKPFQCGNRGSKILVTTRSEEVASAIHAVQTHYLKELSNEDCWLVFADHACFSSTSSQNAKDLEKIGREIVKKCKGLPLAAQSLGGILRRKHDIRDWNNILNSDIWELSKKEKKIIPALRISYHYLPPHLKRCFVYCSLYPKDYEFDKNDLILLWMAEDLLPKSNEGKTLEVGIEYFDYLVSRSFFQRTQQPKYFMDLNGRLPRRGSFVMHDLMHDLATFLGGEFYFNSEELGKDTKISSKTRHLSFGQFNDPILENFGRVKFLRTLLLTKRGFDMVPFSEEKAPCIMLSKLRYLRVLSFRGYFYMDALPDSIGELIHLRYLDLSYIRIKALPESLCNLYNLQTLKLGGCLELIMLPGGMQNLVNLYHLDIEGIYLKEMPKGMSKLNQLQHLPCFYVGKHEENGTKELGGLSNLHGSLSIFNLENVINSSEASEARIMDKKHINKLSLNWQKGDDCTDSQIEIDILCKLQPHQDLQDLSIKGYRGTRFPDWVGNSSYHNMSDLTLSVCVNCWKLPSLGELPSLKNLSISNFNVLETIDASFYKNDDSPHVTPFLSLESLSFGNMACWEVWSSFESDAFSQLKHLRISGCPSLKGALPNHLPALETLQIMNCEQLASFLPRSLAIRTLEIRGSNKVAFQELPLSIKSLKIEGNLLVESMFERINNSQLTCLKYLRLEDCLSEISFPGDSLASLPSLMFLYLSNCRKLEFPKQQKHVLLETLSIDNSCDHLTSLPLETFPNLKNLDIWGCENLESLSASQSLQNLSSFEIAGCPNFVSFPREGLPAPNVTCFDIRYCNKLKSLPRQMNTLLLKLKHLEISGCPEFEWFPEVGMPPNLESICVRNCEKLLSGIAWPSTNMLTKVEIYGPCDGIKSFSNEGLLPASLTTLTLYYFPNLETLDCKGFLHLTSLQFLNIENCPKLENIVGEKLPASLTKLDISYKCPLLQERCHMKHPQIWPKISHINCIQLRPPLNLGFSTVDLQG